MKKKIIVTVLFILMYMLLISCNSCTSSSAQPSNDTLQYEMQDTILKYRADSVSGIQRDLVAINYRDLTPQNDTQKKVVIKKEIKQMEADTTWRLRRDSMHQKLDKTERTIKQQQKVLDSMIVVKKK
jgi:hypothetical protein